MDICGSCGAWAPIDGETCGWCDASLARGRRPLPDDDRLFVAIRLTFDCRGCGLPSPLDALVPDGTVRCVRCQLEQRFERGWWVQVLRAAHAVGDLMGDAPEGRSRSAWSIAGTNPFFGVPVARDGVLEGWVPDTLTVELCTGHPLTEANLAPAQVTIRGDDLTTRGDGEVARYAILPSVRQLYPALLGVIADEHRVDREEPDVGPIAGDAFSCTSCGAALPVDGALRLVRCDFCGAVTHIPAQIRHSVQRDPKPDSWWLVFEGSSPARERLESNPAEVRGLEEPPQLPWPLWRRAVDLAAALVLPGVALVLAAVIWRAPILIAWIRYLLS